MDHLSHLFHPKSEGRVRVSSVSSKLSWHCHCWKLSQDAGGVHSSFPCACNTWRVGNECIVVTTNSHCFLSYSLELTQSLKVCNIFAIQKYPERNAKKRNEERRRKPYQWYVSLLCLKILDRNFDCSMFFLILLHPNLCYKFSNYNFIR